MSVKQKFIEWFTKNNNGCSPAMEDDRGFVHEKTQHMFEAYQAGVAEGEARFAALAAENTGLIEQAEEVYAAGYNHGHLNTVDGIAYADCVKDDFYGLAVELMREAETPATDAFLAEVRAAAVDDACLKISNSIPNCYQDELVGLDMAATICGDFASELRKGVQS